MGSLGLPQCSYLSERLARWQHTEGLQLSPQSLGSLECVYGVWSVTDRQQLGREAHERAYSDRLKIGYFCGLCG